MKKPVRRRMPLYVAIIEAVVRLRNNAAPVVIAREVGAVQDSVSLLCRQMVDAGVLRVVRQWSKGSSGRPQYVFAFDGKPSQDVSESGAKRLAVPASVELLVFCDVLKRLSVGNASKLDLINDIGCSREYSDDLVKRMSDADLIFVSDEAPLANHKPRKLYSLRQNIRVSQAGKSGKSMAKTPLTEPVCDDYMTKRVIRAVDAPSLFGKTKAANSVFALGAA